VRHFPQQRVAGLVPEVVVAELEAVQVDEEQNTAKRRPLRREFSSTWLSSSPNITRLGSPVSSSCEAR
jgi:hypothetical protein